MFTPCLHSHFRQSVMVVAPMCACIAPHFSLASNPTRHSDILNTRTHRTAVLLDKPVPPCLCMHVCVPCKRQRNQPQPEPAINCRRSLPTVTRDGHKLAVVGLILTGHLQKAPPYCFDSRRLACVPLDAAILCPMRCYIFS